MQGKPGTLRICYTKSFACGVCGEDALRVTDKCHHSRSNGIRGTAVELPTLQKSAESQQMVGTAAANGRDLLQSGVLHHEKL